MRCGRLCPGVREAVPTRGEQHDAGGGEADRGEDEPRRAVADTVDEHPHDERAERTAGVRAGLRHARRRRRGALGYIVTTARLTRLANSNLIQRHQGPDDRPDRLSDGEQDHAEASAGQHAGDPVQVPAAAAIRRPPGQQSQAEAERVLPTATDAGPVGAIPA